MTKPLTPREKEIRSLARALTAMQSQVADARARGLPILPYARTSVSNLRRVLKLVAEQSDDEFANWQQS